MRRPLLLAALALAATAARAQPATCGPGPAAPSAEDERQRAAAAFRALADGSDEAACPGATAARAADGALAGEATPLDAAARVSAVEVQAGGERRIVAHNPTDAPAFLALSGDGVPAPLVATFVSRADAGPVPSLVALLDDDRATYGLRLPARATVLFRPAAPEDVRPRGLDE